MDEPNPGAERPEPETAPASDDAAAPDEPPFDGPDTPPEEPAGPRPLGVAVTPTGHPEVDGRLARLGDADHLAVGGHLAVYEDVHRGLRTTLASLDQQPGPRPGAQNDIRS